MRIHWFEDKAEIGKRHESQPAGRQRRHQRVLKNGDQTDWLKK